MSIGVVKDQIKRFLSSDKPEVMAITGNWGVGKTFLWKNFLKEYSDNISLDRYAYVSLFGIDSIESLKKAIFENTIKKNLIGSEADLTSFNESALSVVEKYARQASKFIKKNPITKGFAPTLESFSFLSINKMIICIDDLERAGGTLDKKNVLGLISLLKEEKKCKIVLLLNDNESDLDEYKKHREKVIDLEVKFNPTAAESAGIAYSDDNWISSTLTSFTTRLNIKNIRVLMKIHRLATDAIKIAKNSTKEVRYQILQTISVFAWCHYRSDDTDIPTLDFAAKKLSYKKDQSEEEKRWESTLNEYGFAYADDLDHVIRDAVESGYFIENLLLEKASHNDQKIHDSKAESSFNKAWELYHKSFDDNQSEVVEALYSGLIEGAKFISPYNLNGTVTLLKDLDEEEKASELIDAYIECRRDEPNIFDLNSIISNPFSADITDPTLRAKFNDAWVGIEVDEQLDELLGRLSYSKSWNERDITTFRKFTQVDFYTLFKSAQDKKIHSWIDTAITFGQRDATDNNNSDTYKNVTNALRDISRESPINKRRLERHEIGPE